MSSAFKERCIRGHDLSVTRYRRPSGSGYCRECNRITAREWAARSPDRDRKRNPSPQVYANHIEGYVRWLERRREDSRSTLEALPVDRFTATRLGAAEPRGPLETEGFIRLCGAVGMPWDDYGELPDVPLNDVPLESLWSLFSFAKTPLATWPSRPTPPADTRSNRERWAAALEAGRLVRLRRRALELMGTSA